MRAIEWRGDVVRILDQTALPASELYRDLTTTDQIAEAIRSMRVRGAPALGIIGAMGVAQAARAARSRLPDAVLAAAAEAGRALAATRPTAVNLSWAIDRVLAAGRASAKERADVSEAMGAEAVAIQSEDEAACTAMAENALVFFGDRAVVLTHCNTGALCTGGVGTALGAIRRAHEAGRGVAVLVGETRPLLQGARLTAWELGRLGIPHAVVVDAAAPSLIARGEVSLVVVGADRVCANGDVANKIGTYPLALAAAAAGVPFIVVAPTSTIDLRSRDGSHVTIEERPVEEVLTILGTAPVTPTGSGAVNPAFDVTPASLITAIVTEHGVARAPFGTALARMARGKPAEPSRRAAAARKPPARKPPARKPPARKPPARKPPARKPPARKPPARKPPARKPPARKPPARKPPARKPPARKQARPAAPSSRTRRRARSR